jgi:hypothetical protein
MEERHPGEAMQSSIETTHPIEARNMIEARTQT